MKKILAVLFLLGVSPAHAGSITFTLVQGGFGNLAKTYTVTDAEIVRIIAAYQSAANTAVNGTATRVQVLNYWLGTLIADTVDIVKTAEQPVAPPPPTPIKPQ